MHFELSTLLAALDAASELPRCEGLPVVVCHDSKADLMLLDGHAAAQTSCGPSSITWRQPAGQSTCSGLPVHCGLLENERADTLDKEATQAGRDQQTTPVDVRTPTQAVPWSARKRWQAGWPDHELVCPMPS